MSILFSAIGIRLLANIISLGEFLFTLALRLDLLTLKITIIKMVISFTVKVLKTWWACQDLNLGPRPYQRRALTS